MSCNLQDQQYELCSGPEQFQLTNKYYPSNSTFTKGFTEGTYKFNGLNTTKTVSNVYNHLNDF